MDLRGASWISVSISWQPRPDRRTRLMPGSVVRDYCRRAARGDRLGWLAASWPLCQPSRSCARPGHLVRMVRRVLEKAEHPPDSSSAGRQLPTPWRRSGRLVRSRPAGVSRCRRHGLPRCRCRLVSLRLGCFVGLPVPGDRIDERLVVCFALACGHGRRLTVGLGYELGRADVRHPDLDRTKALATQPFPMLSYTLAGRRHTPMLHVTMVVVDQQPRGFSPAPHHLPPGRRSTQDVGWAARRRLVTGESPGLGDLRDGPVPILV